MRVPLTLAFAAGGEGYGDIPLSIDLIEKGKHLHKRDLETIAETLQIERKDTWH